MTDFVCTWLNRLDQFDSVSIDLIVDDQSGVIPQQRVSKNYAVPYDQVDDVFLAEEAANEVDRIVTEWNTPEVPE